MSNRPIPIRKLSDIEQAFTISNEAMPLCVVCVLHLENGPEISRLESALHTLQQRHRLLQAGIYQNKDGFFFYDLDPVPPLSLEIVTREDDRSVKNFRERAVNSGVGKEGPLMKCWYLTVPGAAASELIVSFHHAIIDGNSARLILHEILCLCGNTPLPPPVPLALDTEYPTAFRKAALLRKLPGFAWRQMQEEWQYRNMGLQAPIPEDSANATVSLRLSTETSRQLSVRIGRKGHSLNTVLLAAITLAVVKYQHDGPNRQQARVISFADIRPALIPPPEQQELGCYISMLRLNVPVSRSQSVWDLAGEIRKALFQASRKGEVLIMSRISRFLVSMVLKLKNTRLGVSALSFIGKLDLEPLYGAIALKHVEAFITNNRFGPEFSGFGKILFGAISLDFTYLTTEMEEQQAGKIVKEIEDILVKMANS